MNYLGYTCLFTYFGILIVLSIYGVHRYHMVWLYYWYKKNVPVPKGTFQSLPRVTVQLPVYNEMYVVRRLIESVVLIDYPRELLEIQVLDDSTDETRNIAAECVAEMRKRGHDIIYIHRDNRDGFKAGALENGLKSAQGEFLAVFDADFVPNPDIILKTIQFFTDNEIGMVQVRWGHLNADYSVLTEIQSILLDGHFMIEHTARNRSGRFFNFNGTAGIWRRECIIDGGGWQHDTLTEDLDLSYRAQMKGWKFAYLNDVVVPAELPVEMNSFKTQQHRWAKGSIQTGKKILPRLWKSKVPLKVKIEATFHLTNNISYLLMIAVCLLMFPSVLIRNKLGWPILSLIDIPLFFAASFSLVFFYICSQIEIYKGWIKKLRYIPLITSVGIGLCVNNSSAVLEALFNVKTAFTRTPKFGIERANDNWRSRKYRGIKSFYSLIELLFSLYFTFFLVFALMHGMYLLVPFLVLFQIGFLNVAFLSFFQGRIKNKVSV